MRLGLIADIHGNIEALDAVLQHLEQHAVDMILCAGDLVAYGATPNQVIRKLKDQGIPSVAGNYDDAVAWDKAKASRKASSARNEPLKQAALDWTKKVIRPANKQFLKQLPWQLSYQLDGKRLVVLHAGLDYLDEWLVPEDDALLQRTATRLAADIVVLGHTHRAFSQQVGDTLFINPGAVGRSLDGDPRASCAVLDTNTLISQHQRVSYDLAPTLNAIYKSSMPREIGVLIKHAARRIEEVHT
ncbi:MAG: metallophosphoesterase family protein [Deinococcota bacterium]